MRKDGMYFYDDKGVKLYWHYGQPSGFRTKELAKEWFERKFVDDGRKPLYKKINGRWYVLDKMIDFDSETGAWLD